MKLSELHKTSLWHYPSEINAVHTKWHEHIHSYPHSYSETSAMRVMSSVILFLCAWVCVWVCVHASMRPSCYHNSWLPRQQGQYSQTEILTRGALLHTTSSVVNMELRACTHTHTHTHTLICGELTIVLSFQCDNQTANHTAAGGPITSLYVICEAAEEKVLLNAALCDLYVSLPYSRHIWEILCTMANSTQCIGSSPVQWVSPVDQYNHSDSMISSSSPLSECGRRVGAGRRRASTGKERWKSDGVREEGRFQSQRWLREMFLPSI